MPHRDYEKRVATTEAERIAITAAKLAVNDALNEVFAAFGVSRGNVESMEEFRADLGFIRTLRVGSSKAGGRFIMTVVTLAATAFAYGLWSWAKATLLVIK